MKITLCSNKNDFAHNTKFMFEYLLDKKEYEIKYIINDDKLREKLIQKYGDRFITTKDKEGLRFLKGSDVWLLDSGMPTKNILYMKNKIIINFWHGIPIKKIGINGYRGVNKLRMFLQLKLFSYFVTAYSTTSKNIINIMAQSFILPKEKVKVLGQPRNDYLKNNISKTVITNLFEDIENNSKFVLYAPTWRKSKYGTSMKESVIYFPFDEFDTNEFNQFLKEQNIVVFVRPHSLEKISIEESSNIKILDNSLVDNINDILNVFDLLISDYSGIFVDYLLLDKPILLLPYDLEEYISTKGLNFEFDSINPGPFVKNYEDFKSTLLKLLNDKSCYREKRERLNKFFNEIEYPCIPTIMRFIEQELRKK